MKQRVVYLDILKAIAVFLVVFCHFVLLSPTIPANIFMSACWMAVPVFFMVNGALLFARPLHLKKHFRKTAGMYAVLVVWKLIYLLTVGPLTGAQTAGMTAGGVFNYLFLFGELPGIINGHLWFIEALLAVYLFFPVFRIAFDWEGAAQNAAREQGGKKDGDKTGGALAGRRLLWVFAVLSLVCTNGLYSFGVLGSMLRAAGIPFAVSADSLAAFQPFGKYGNMLGFFLLGALLSSCKGPVCGSVKKQRASGAAMLTAGLAALWGVKCFLSGQAEWDGILLQEGYRHVPVIFMAAGLFLLCKDMRIRQKWLLAPVRALASRTLGIFYIHWLLGWLLVNPLAGRLLGAGIAFSVGTNILKTIVLMAPAFILTLIIERIPVIKKLVTG